MALYWITDMVLDAFKKGVLHARKELEKFKSDHTMASAAVSAAIESLPPPFNHFCKIVWDGLEKEDNSGEKMLAILKKMEENSEESFDNISTKLSELIEKGAGKVELQRIGEEIATSTGSLAGILDSHLVILKSIEQLSKKTYEMLASGTGNYDPLRVSYTLIEVNKGNSQDTLQKIASAMNLKLFEENQQTIPFVPPKRFDILKQRNKLFLSGRTDSGKSRTVLELIGDKIKNFQNIYIINPQSPIGKESRISTISELINKQRKETDAIIWHNFPDDLENAQVNVESGKTALAKISSGSVRSLFVTLNPLYQELYGNTTFPEIDVEEINYDRQTTQKIVMSYGRNISRFKKVYS